MSARAPRERLIGVFVSLVLLVLIGWAATHRTGSEADRHAATLDVLRSMGVRQARAEVSGAEVTVYGIAEDRHQRERAIRGVGDVSGVRLVTDRLSVGVDPGEPSLTAAAGAPSDGAPSLQPTAASPAPASTPPARPRTAPQARSAEPSAAPDTPASSDPCEAPPAAVRRTQVGFTSSSATLASAGHSVLSTVARHLVACPDTLMEIRAYADQATDPAANLVLSRQRANVVVGHLSKLGVAPHRLVATYRGDQAPGGNLATLTLHQDTAR